LQQPEFGSGDLSQCYIHAASDPSRVGHFIELLYFVRVTICNYRVKLGYDQPYQLLLAQLHPTKFFGLDLCKELFESLARKNVTVST
jgi:hypothetical protein